MNLNFLIFNTRKTWKLINSLTNKKHVHLSNKVFTINNIQTQDKLQIATEFNKLFTEMGPALAKNIPNVMQPPPQKVSIVKDSMAILMTDACEIYNIISTMKSSSSW